MAEPGPAPGRLIIVCGLPGSGKTTVATQLARLTGARRFSADEWLAVLGIGTGDHLKRAVVEAIQWDLMLELLGLGGWVVVEWGSWRRHERDRARLAAREVGAAVELVYLHAPLDTLMERIARRGRDDGPISRAMMEGWMKEFEPPDAAEMALFDPPLRRRHG